MKTEVKSERAIIPAPMGTRAVFVDKYKVTAGDHIVGFKNIGSEDVEVLTVFDTWRIASDISKDGYCDGCFGVMFPDGQIDTYDFGIHENIDALQKQIDAFKATLEQDHD